MTQTLLSDFTSIRPKVFVVGDGSTHGEGYMSAFDQIRDILATRDDLTLVEIDAEARDRFGSSSIHSLKNAINRAVKRGDVEITRGRENRYRLPPSSS